MAGTIFRGLALAALAAQCAATPGGSVEVKTYAEALYSFKGYDSVAFGMFWSEKDYEYRDFKSATFSFSQAQVQFIHSFDSETHDKYEEDCEHKFPCILVGRGFDFRNKVVRKREKYAMQSLPETWDPTSIFEFVHVMSTTAVSKQLPGTLMLQREVAQFKGQYHTRLPNVAVYTVNSGDFDEYIDVCNNFRYTLSCLQIVIDFDVEESEEQTKLMIAPEEMEHVLDLIDNGHQVFVFNDEWDAMRDLKIDLTKEDMELMFQDIVNNVRPRDKYKLRSGYHKSARHKAKVEKERKEEEKYNKKTKDERKKKKGGKKGGKKDEGARFDEL